MFRFVMPPARPVTAAPKTAAAPSTVLYGQETGDTVAISVSDIHQGSLGDCFLLAAIGELAVVRPGAIASMIHVNANGSETVALYGDVRGHLPGPSTSAFKPLAETVTNVFSNGVNSGATQGLVAGQKEIWSQVLEKAYALAGGGYNSIAGGGSPILAMEALTGHAASFQSAASLTFAQLTADVQASDLIVMDTAGGRLPFGLMNYHAYMFEGVSMVAGVAEVRLGNPWGFDQPSLIPLAHPKASPRSISGTWRRSGRRGPSQRTRQPTRGFILLGVKRGGGLKRKFSTAETSCPRGRSAPGWGLSGETRVIHGGEAHTSTNRVY